MGMGFMPLSALVLDGVTVRRGGKAVVEGASVTFAPGRLAAVIGPNGAGKSSLLEAAAGILVPTAGSVRLGSQDLATIGRRALALCRAYLPQRATVEWPISVERVVALGLTPSMPTFGDVPDAMMPAVERALGACDLLHLRERPATQLSGGELARTMLARAIVGEPEVLIADEPTSGLDPRHAIDAARRLRALADAGCTVIVAIHDLDLALAFADDAVAIRGGRILAAGPVAEVMTRQWLEPLFEIGVHVSHDGHGAAIRFHDRPAADISKGHHA